MTRNLRLAFAGTAGASAVLSLGVLYVGEHWIAQTERGLRRLEALIGAIGFAGAGPGSGIRVVGGSIILHILSKGPSVSTSTSSSGAINQLTATSADAWTISLDGVSSKRGGKLRVPSPSYTQSQGSVWTVRTYDSYPTDDRRGLEITGWPGGSHSSGLVKIAPMQSGDSFEPPTTSATDTQWPYRNSQRKAHCPPPPTAGASCETVDVIEVNVNGATDTWYCVADGGKCNVNIGSSPQQ
jgi:hypothetical protein